MLTCKIISPDQISEYDGLDGVSLPTTDGEIQICPKHAECFGLLEKGSILLFKSAKVYETITVNRGGFHLKNDSLRVIL